MFADRSHIFTSDHHGALNSLIPDTSDRNKPGTPLAKPIAFCAGTGFLRLQPKRSVVYHRNRGRGQPAELFIRSVLLRGLVPEVLLYNFTFWSTGAGTIVGEPRKTSVQAAWYNYKLEIKLHSDDGLVGADVCRVNPDGETMMLLDLSRAPVASLLHRLARTCEKFVSGLLHRLFPLRDVSDRSLVLSGASQPPLGLDNRESSAGGFMRGNDAGHAKVRATVFPPVRLIRLEV